MCLATLSITIKQPGLVIIGICNLGSGSLCQLRVDLGSFNKILTLPNLYFEDKISKEKQALEKQKKELEEIKSDNSSVKKEKKSCGCC